MKKVDFENDKYYHILNRGVDKRSVFLNDNDYLRFLKSLIVFNQKDPVYSMEVFDRVDVEVQPLQDKLVDIVAYCLNPNHYHLILRQRIDGGISEFMKRVGGGYTGYFNRKYDRNGSLFQGNFKRIYINSNQYLLYLSAYVNKNYFIHGYGDEKWKYSSLLEYVGKRKGFSVCNKEVIISKFNDIDEYKIFIDKNALYMKEVKNLRKYLIE